jgi:PAS domain S-box-containing protein
VVRYVSPAGEHILGHEVDEILGEDGVDFVHPDDRERAQEVLRRIVERGGTHYVDLKLLHKDGSARMVECVAQNLLDDPVVKGIVLNYRDITPRKKAEEALRRSEEKFSKAFHSSPDSVTLSDISDGHFIEVNEGFEQVTGYARDEIVGKTAVELELWQDPDDRIRLIKQLVEDGSVRHFEANIRRKDGSIRNCLFAADMIDLDKCACMVAVTRDITEHKEAEMLLWEIAERLKLEREESSEKDIALKQVLAHIEKEKAAYKHDVSASVENLLTPVINKLKKRAGHLDNQDIARLERGVYAIVGEDMDPFQSNMTKLTPRETDICEFIKNGLSSKEIADRLGLSPQTVHKHRQLIRRKLQLSNKNVNLSTYLRAR